MARRLRIARQAMDLDQVQLATDLGISQGALSKLECGRSGAGRINLSVARWIEILGVHARYVLNGVGASRYDEKRIRERYNFKRFNGRCPDPDNQSYVNRRKKRLTLK